jgi:hypothetical protein
MKLYYCIANDPDGIEITPRSLSRVRQGRYCVPDCVDYESKFNLPRRVKTKEVYAGWNCHNCKYLKEVTNARVSPAASSAVPVAEETAEQAAQNHSGDLFPPAVMSD